MTRLIDTLSGARAFVDSCRRKNLTVGLVPTMGAFHTGHLSLIRQARQENGAVIVSIFVNPLQFSAGEDFDRYPRRLQQDFQMAEGEGADIVFTPSVAEMYPKGFDTAVDQMDLPAKLCGAFRPGHFRGVMTIVSKLFNIIHPDAAYFGQKDYQQYLIIRRMADDLNLNVRVKLLPTKREEDGLAMSSRNAYLGPKQRKDAGCIYQALRAAEERIAAGENSAPKVLAEMKKIIRRVKGVRIEYVEAVNSESLEPVREIKGKTLIAVAIRIGKARLIDNVIV